MDIWKRAKKWLPIIGIAIFVYILLKLDIREIGREIAGAKLIFLILALGLVLISFVFQTIKWYVLARKQKINVPFGKAFKINLVAHFYGFITPSKLGTILRAEYLKKYTDNIGKGVSNFVLDKMLDISSLFFLAIVFSFLFREKFSGLVSNYLLIIIALFLGFVFFCLIFMKKERTKYLLGFVYRKFVPERMKEKVRLAFDSFYEDFPKKRFLIYVFGINLINWVIIYLTTYAVGLSLGIDINFIYFLAILPISTLIAQLPITVNGLGTREAVMISLFGLFGVAGVKVFSMSLIGLILGGVFPALIGFFFIFKENGKEIHETKESE